MNKKVPYHLGLIIDGNRRWARKRGLLPMLGHEAGYQKVKKMGDWCLARGIKIVTIYAFSCENWQRPKREVDFLMKLILRALIEEIDYFNERSIRLKIIGQAKGLSQEVMKSIKLAEQKTANNKVALLNLAINYSGRVEILEAVRAIIRHKIQANKVDEELLDRKSVV